MPRLIIFAILIAIQLGMALHEPPAPPREGIHVELQPYVDRFIQYGKHYRGENFEMQQINMDIGEARDLWDPFINAGTVGWCKPLMRPLEIMIDSGYWEDITELEKEQLVFHELGHCILDADHVEELDADGDPVSIMHPYTIDEHIYIKHREEYIQKLFAR